jgi:hypothetical protein
MKKILTTAFLWLSFQAIAQQLDVPVSSPLQQIRQDISLSFVTLEYSRPSARNRVVFGDLVPYDKVWRTGANQSTKITFGEGIQLEGNQISPGKYALYTIPGKTEWTIILSKNTTWWGAYGYTDTEDVLRFKVRSESLSLPLETLTIGFDKLTQNSAIMTIAWEKTRVPVKVKADNDAQVMKNIQDAMDPRDRRPYIAAANYYYEIDKDLNKALEWINKSLEMEPKAYWAVLLKGKIQLKLNDKEGAAASATKVISLAKEDKSDEYISLGEKLLADAKAK